MSHVILFSIYLAKIFFIMIIFLIIIILAVLKFRATVPNFPYYFTINDEKYRVMEEGRDTKCSIEKYIALLNSITLNNI